MAGGMHGRGHAWQGGMHGREECMAGSMHGRGVYMAGGMRGRRDGHYNGRYTSYWNAFLFIHLLVVYLIACILTAENQ